MSTIYDWSFADRLQCSQYDRRQCLELVTELVNLAAKARRLGLLSLVETIDGEMHFLLDKGLQLVVDGVKPEVVRRILENYILSDNCRGKELLIRCLILEGISGIQNGANPKNLKEMLLSLFGADGPAAYDRIYQQNGENDLDGLLKSLEKTDLPGASNQGSALGELSDRDVRECLKEINTLDLARAVQAMSGKDQMRIFKNLSRRGASHLQEVLARMDPATSTQAAAAQAKIQSIIEEIKTRSAAGGLSWPPAKIESEETGEKNRRPSP